MELPNAPRRLSSYLSCAPVEISHELAHEGRSVAFARERQNELEAGVVIGQDERIVMSTAGANERAYRIAVYETAGVGGLVA